MSYAKPSAARLVDQRARRRATQALIDMHRDEFRELYQWHRHNAAETHSPDEPPRLLTGVRKPGQSPLDRIDVARCRRCHHHHDNGHVCQNCGLDERSSDALENEYDDDDLRADFRRDEAEAVWS